MPASGTASLQLVVFAMTDLAKLAVQTTTTCSLCFRTSQGMRMQVPMTVPAPLAMPCTWDQHRNHSLVFDCCQLIRSPVPAHWKVSQSALEPAV